MKKTTKKQSNKHTYHFAAYGYLMQILRRMKQWHNLTNEKLAELLCITPRSCSDILNGRQGVGAATVLCFLASIPEEYALKILRQFRKNILNRKEVKIPVQKK